MIALLATIIDGIDIENIVALICLTIIGVTATLNSGNVPPVINTIVGGIIGYLARSYTDTKKP